MILLTQKDGFLPARAEPEVKIYPEGVTLSLFDMKIIDKCHSLHYSLGLNKNTLLRVFYLIFRAISVVAPITNCYLVENQRIMHERMQLMLQLQV